jgi:hypothetical protein
MRFDEVIAELPRLTFEERQVLIRRALELDDPPLSAADEELSLRGIEVSTGSGSDRVAIDAQSLYSCRQQPSCRICLVAFPLNAVSARSGFIDPIDTTAWTWFVLALTACKCH